MAITEKPSNESGRGHCVTLLLVYLIRKPEKPNQMPLKTK